MIGGEDVELVPAVREGEAVAPASAANWLRPGMSIRASSSSSGSTHGPNESQPRTLKSVDIVAGTVIPSTVGAAGRVGTDVQSVPLGVGRGSRGVAPRSESRLQGDPALQFAQAPDVLVAADVEPTLIPHEPGRGGPGEPQPSERRAARDGVRCVARAGDPATRPAGS